jgi:LysR family cyn operon transcriptional activator
MEMRQLQYFAAIARHGGLRQAADELNISPGNLSEQIKTLERELEVRLFDRGPRGLTLTEAGGAFLERVDQALTTLRTAREEMSDFAHLERGQLLVGALPGLGPFWLAEFLVVFLNRYRHIDLHLIERSSALLVKMLGSGEVHVGCVLLRGNGSVLPSGVRAQPLSTASLAAVVAPQHPLAHEANLRLEQLAHEPLILTSPEETPRTIVDDAFSALGIEPDVRFEANDPLTLVRLAAGGVGVGITGERIGRSHADRVVTIPIVDADMTYSLCVAWAAERGPHMRALDTFVSFLVTWWRDERSLIARGAGAGAMSQSPGRRKAESARGTPTG